MALEAATPHQRRVLIIEDEVLISVLLEDMLIDLGYEVVGMVSRIEEALLRLGDTPIDAAVLDLNLNGQSALPVAQSLLERGIPFLLVTGYGQHGLPASFKQVPVLEKPFQQAALDAKLKSILPPG